MRNEREFTDFDQPDVVAEQARKVRALYPELFAALDSRDRRIKKALQRIPHPADPEALVPPGVFEEAIASLRRLEPGIGFLVHPPS